jgi:hypothetical protein
VRKAVIPTNVGIQQAGKNNGATRRQNLMFKENGLLRRRVFRFRATREAPRKDEVLSNFLRAL